MSDEPDAAALYGPPLADMVDAFDWAATPIGPRADWPPQLAFLVDLTLASALPKFVVWGPAQTLIYNDPYARILGLQHPGALGRPFLDVWSELRDSIGWIVDRAYAGQPTQMSEIALTMMRHGYPEETHFSFSYTPMRGPDGVVAGFLGTCLETTSQFLAQREREETQGRLRNVLDGMGEGFIILDRDFRVVEINGERLRADGRPREAIVGKHLLEAWPEAAAMPTWPMYQEAMATREPRDIEFRYRSDRHDIWMEVRAYPVDSQLAVFFRDVSPRRRAEAAARENDERLRLIVDGAADYAILTTDPDRRVTSWSPGAATAFGFAADEMVGEHADRLFTPEDLAAGVPAAEAAQALRDGFAPDIRWHQRKDGSRVFLNGAMRPLYDAAGQHIGFLKIARDETERRAHEAALIESEERLRLATDAAEVGFWDVDTVNDVLHWPPRVKAMFGISADVPVSMADFYAGLHPADREATAAAYGAAADPAVRGLYDVEYRTIGKEDGIVRWVAAKGRGVFDDEGRCIRVIGTAIDVTARKAIEQRLRDLNETLERRVAEAIAERDRAWNNARDVQVVIAADGLFRAVNPAWTAILGHAPDEVVGHSYTEFVMPEDLAAARDALQEAATARDLTDFENRFRHKKGGYRWISWHTASEGDLVYGYGRDVTEEKARQAALEQAQEQLRQAQKMEAVGQLTGGIAHDFNNLLTGVIGSLDLLQRRLARGETDKVERYATAAITSANRAAALTHRLLAFSRRQPLDPKPVNANRLITGMEELLRRTIGETIQLEIVTAGGLWQTRCDPNQLESAILNLAINARDAMPDGGTLTIETCNAHLDSAYAAQSREVAPGQYVCICVTDTGTGMTPDVMARVFEPFFTTKPIGQGTGLGLSMIYGFARQSDGYAKIYSEPAQGTTFKLYLPRHYGEGTDPTDGVAADVPPHRADQGEVVLVVEDEAAVRDLVVEILQDMGYRAVEAVDGPSGLRLIESDLRIDLLVTDIGLPGLNGRQLADAARAIRPELRILFMTGYAENATLANGFLEPGMEMITKPFAIDTLASRIKEMIERDEG